MKREELEMGMKRIIGAAAATALALYVAQPAAAADVFTLSSPAFKDGELLAKKNAGANKANPNCVGENVSPPLQWSNPPAGTVSYVLLMIDPEGRGGLGVDHWLAYGIPASVTGFAEGETSQPSEKYVGGKGTAGQGTYLGPCTPPGLTKPELMEKLAGHTKSATGLIGLFKNPL